MKIIISPSKEMDFKNPNSSDIKISENTKEILKQLKKLKKEELKSLFKISDKITDEVYKYYQNFEKNPSYSALDLYNGMAFKEMKFNSEDVFANENVVILSAFYGPIRPDNLIKPYRLDFNTRLKINGMSLKKLWERPFNEYFREDETILNLSSEEFSNILERKRLNIIDFIFYEEKDGREKIHSTISKKMRGKMTSYIVENRLKISEIKDFNEDGYRFMKDRSNENLFVFSKKLTK